MNGDTSVLFRFLIAALATWRVAFLLARERGPWDLLGRFRRVVAGGIGGGLLACVKCVGLWVAVPFAFFVRSDGWEVVVIWLALAGVTALIDEWLRPPFEWQGSREDAPSERGADRREAVLADDDRRSAR